MRNWQYSCGQTEYEAKKDDKLKMIELRRKAGLSQKPSVHREKLLAEMLTSRWTRRKAVNG